MKSISILLVVLMILLGKTESFAQREKGEAFLTGAIGLSIWNLYASVANLTDSINVTSTPTFHATYDYGITKEFSVGAGISYNSFSFINPNYSYVNSGGTIVEESISVKYGRTNIALRPLYHWGKNEDLEWHTGLRLGYSFWTAQINTTDPYYTDDFYRENLYSAQILFGSRAFLTDLIAITFDVGIGSPYFASFGFSIKL